MTDETTTHDQPYPPLPEFGDERWQEAAIAPAKQRSTQLRPAPRTTMSTGQATVFAGDIIHIVPEIQYDDWVAARVGRKVGWLNTDDVDFVDPNIPKPKLEELTKPLTDTDSFRQLVTKELDDGNEIPAQPERPQPVANGTRKSPTPSLEDLPVNLTIAEIDALLENIKGIAMTLQQAKTRVKREARARRQNTKQAAKQPAMKKDTKKSPRPDS